MMTFTASKRDVAPSPPWLQAAARARVTILGHGRVRVASNLGISVHAVRQLTGKAPRRVNRGTTRRREPTAKTGERVRCLGGCGGSFDSPDRRTCRICPTCTKRNAAAGSTYEP